MSRLLFRGTKTFWKTKSYLEVAIFEFADHNVYEIIAYDPVLQKHAPRLHVNIKATISVCSNETTSQGQHEKSSLNMDSVVTTFLFNHIILTEYLPISKLIKINFYKSVNDIEVIIPRPLNLPFMVSPFAVFYGGGAESFPVGSVNHLQIPLREKWRLPLILVRVSKGLPLCEYDSKIWACFVHNKTQEELVEYIAATLAARVPMASREVLRYTAHSALLPDNCPFPTSRSGSGTASPVTLSRSSSRCNSRSSSRAPSRDSSPSRSGVAAVIPVVVPACKSPSIAATGTSAAVVHSLSSWSGESVPTTTPPRTSTKLGLPPLTPSSHKIFRTRSDGSAHSSPYQPCSKSTVVNITATTTIAGNIVSDSIPTTPVKTKTPTPAELEPLPLRKVNSFNNLWPVRMTRSAFTSLSAPSSPQASPQASPRKIVPTKEEEVTWTGDDDEVFAGLDGLSVDDSGERVSIGIKPSARQRIRHRNSQGGGRGRVIEVKPRGAPRGGVEKQGGAERGDAVRQGGAPRGGVDKQGGVVVHHRALPHIWSDGHGLSQWAAGLLKRQVRRGSRDSGTVTPMNAPISPISSDDED